MSKKRKGEESGLNMYDVIPRPIVKSETIENDTVVLLKPKYKNPFLVKHLIPRMKHPFYKINLDDTGSAVWNKIDGFKNAVEIAEELEKELGEKIQPIYERLGIFLSMLKRGKFITY